MLRYIVQGNVAVSHDQKGLLTKRKWLQIITLFPERGFNRGITRNIICTAGFH